MDPINFDRKPYIVTYYKDGEKKSYRRVPPPKLHDALPTDIVELTERHNDDFPENENYTVKGINPRHPNVLQLENDEGVTAFVSHYDINLKEMIAEREGIDPRDMPARNRYLLWP